jgi:hypothetical protein
VSFTLVIDPILVHLNFAASKSFGGNKVFYGEEVSYRVCKALLAVYGLAFLAGLGTFWPGDSHVVSTALVARRPFFAGSVG